MRSSLENMVDMVEAWAWAYAGRDTMAADTGSADNAGVARVGMRAGSSVRMPADACVAMDDTASHAVAVHGVVVLPVV